MKIKRNKDGSCPNCGLTVNGMTVKEEKRLLKIIKETEKEECGTIPFIDK